MSKLDDNIERFGEAFMKALMTACLDLGIDPMPFVAFVFEPDGFKREVYEHVYAKAEETKALFPDDQQPFVVGVAPLEDGSWGDL